MSPKNKGEWNGKPKGKSNGKDVEEPPRGRLNVSKMVVKPFDPRTKKQLAALRMMEDKDVVFLIGPAGTSKTFLAAKVAIDRLKAKEIDNIFVVRPAVEAGESVGFLSGDLNAKVAPYIRPVLENLMHFVGKSVVEQLVNSDVIETTSMTYSRGRSLHRTVMILDEMQNASPSQLRLLLTRIGDGSLAVVTMDPDQIDLDDDKPSAYEDLWRFDDEPRIGFIYFNDNEIVRSEAAKMVGKCYRKKYQGK